MNRRRGEKLMSLQSLYGKMRDLAAKAIRAIPTHACSSASDGSQSIRQLLPNRSAHAPANSIHDEKM